jgi:hypothetical protein
MPHACRCCRLQDWHVECSSICTCKIVATGLQLLTAVLLLTSDRGQQGSSEYIKSCQNILFHENSAGGFEAAYTMHMQLMVTLLADVTSIRALAAQLRVDENEYVCRLELSRDSRRSDSPPAPCHVSQIQTLDHQQQGSLTNACGIGALMMMTDTLWMCKSKSTELGCR